MSRSRASLRRRLTEILAAADPTAPPPTGARRTAETLRARRRLAEADANARRLIEGNPEILAAVEKLEIAAPNSAEETEALDWVLRILTGTV